MRPTGICAVSTIQAASAAVAAPSIVSAIALRVILAAHRLDAIMTTISDAVLQRAQVAALILNRKS